MQRRWPLFQAWISHIHADHHVGLVSILRARRELLGAAAPPLLVCGPWPLQRWLAAYSAHVEPIGALPLPCAHSAHWKTP